MLDNYFKIKNKNCFTYAVYENVLNLFYDELTNEAEHYYYNKHKRDHYKNLGQS